LQAFSHISFARLLIIIKFAFIADYCYNGGNKIKEFLKLCQFLLESKIFLQTIAGASGTRG